MKILLIAAHGSGDPGAIGCGCREGDEARKLLPLIAGALRGFADVATYDMERNAYADHQKGSLRTIAQFSKYDYVLEIHFNAFRAGAADGKTKGVECYVTTQEASTKVETAIVARLSALGLANRGVKRYNWSVINTAKQSGASAALLEVCFIDDEDDMKVYTKSRQAVAQAIADGIKEGFGLSEKEMTTAEAKAVLMDKAGLSAATITYLDCYKYADALLVKLAGAMK